MKQNTFPKIVAIGGGTGLATVLRGLKSFLCEITAIVTVADDGGSSGRLRQDMGILPPGDIRNCLVALAEAEPDMTALFNHRFSKGELAGHNFGNLFLAAMTELTGDFQVAVRAMSRILAVKGKVLPATLSSVSLYAEMENGAAVHGEAAIPLLGGRIKRLSLRPKCPPALDEAVEEIKKADGLVIGPGSLYTSILPNLLVDGICQAIKNSCAPKLYVCNVMTQPGETDDYNALDHVQAIQDHCGTLFTHVLVNTSDAGANIGAKYSEENKYQVEPSIEALVAAGCTPIVGDYLAAGCLAHHDPIKLAKAIVEFVTAENNKDRLESLKAGTA